VTKLAYNASKQLTKVTGPSSTSSSSPRTQVGASVRIKEPDGGLYRYAYDANDNLTSVNLSRRHDPAIIRDTAFPKAHSTASSTRTARFCHLCL